MKTCKEIRKELKDREEIMQVAKELSLLGASIYCKGWIDALKWVLKK